MDDSESPSPLDETPVRSRRDSDQPRRGHWSSKDRDRLYMGGSTSELARLLVYQERNAKDLRRMLADVTEQLKVETQRADAAEMRAREAALRFKTSNDAKLQVQQDAERTKQALELYKLQLENAQREINRAQQIIDSVEAQRIEAEEVAARARSTARRLREEKLTQQAREEGRREGYEEGLAQGRNLGFEEGRAEGYARGRATAARSRRRYSGDMETPVDEQGVVDEPLPQRTRSSPDEYDFRPHSGYVQSIRQGSPGPQRSRAPAPERVRTPGPMPAEPPKVVDPEVPPINVRNVVQSPGHLSVEFPPDNWIPKMDGGGRIRMPPQNEMGPPPPTPSPPPSVPLQNAMENADDRPPLMVPPPGGDLGQLAMMSDSDMSTPVRPRHRRRRSNESQSTTMSQFEILGPPVVTPGRSVARERSPALSAIAEERERSSSMSSPTVGGGIGSPYAQSTGSTFYQPLRAHPSGSDIGRRYEETAPSQDFYTNPHAHTASPDSARPMIPSSPSSLRPPSHLRNSQGSSLSPDFNIEVEPPSGPESVNSESAPMTPNLLRVDNLPPMPPPVDPTEPPPQIPAQIMSMPGVIPPVPGQGATPVVLTDGQLPRGFQPIGPPISPSAFTMGGSQPPSAVIPPSSFVGSVGPAGIPLPPSTYGGTPSVAGSSTQQPTYPATEPVIPHLMPSAGSGPSAVRYSRTALRDSSSDSDDAVSSALGSLDSLTTPPSRSKRLPKGAVTPKQPLYQEAPVPESIRYPVPPTPRSTSSRGTTAARVPLPPSAGASMASPTSTVYMAPGSVGPYSQTPYSRSNLALDAGRTPLPMNRPMSPFIGSAGNTPAPLPAQVERRASIYDLHAGGPEDDLTRSNAAVNALPPQPSPRMNAAPLGSPVIPEASLVSGTSGTKPKKGKKKKGK